ncbi:carboxypeptidase M32 [Bacillus altitudinis]|uniref:Metal-dependent carboxypeptidase n=1 Tax=Bacillus altitudinis TaxID=293387 RepID=A0ABV1S976_BACAB
MSLESKEKAFYQLLGKIAHYTEALHLLYWDSRTQAPKKSADFRAETIGQLSSDIFNMKTSDEMRDLLDALNKEKEKLSKDTQKALELSQKEYDENSKIPKEEFKEYSILQSKAEHVWVEAREKSDFSLFAPYLKQLIDFNKRFIQYWGVKKTPYDVLLNNYEPDMTVEQLDQKFGALRDAIVPLVKKIEASPNKPDTSFLSKSFPIDKQKELSLFFLKELGYDFDAGRLDTTVHPFAVTLSRGDVRVTTRYDEHDFRMAIFGTIHECGHAIYEQNIDEALSGTLLCDGTSMGIHESQSLFFENFIGRHEDFWKTYYQKLQEASPEQFKDVTLEEFVHAVNESKPTYIRIEADELTYPLHIIIRYEIEKAIFNEDVAVEDLPALWNEKYKAYLGITPPNDALGILQDVHWSDGSFGYFPSYALGYMYAAQLKQQMIKDLPNFDELIQNGSFAPIKEWLTEHVHKHGKRKKPSEIIQDATGEELNVQYLIDYLTDKYTKLYLS